MRRLAGVGMLAALLLAQAGCIAVSAKEMHSGMRYETVAVNGKLYVVDKCKRTARPVVIVTECEDTDR